jgi:hypothetical protein
LRRLLAAVGVVSVGLLSAFGDAAAASGPKPEPPPAGALRSLRPDPAPTASTANTVTTGSASSPRSSSTPVTQAPSTAATSSSSVRATQPTASSSAQPAPSTSSGSTARTQPPAASHAARAKPHVVQKAARKRSHHTSVRLPALLSVPAFLRDKLHLGAGGAVVEPASNSSTLWFIGALALVVLALGETTFLTYVMSRVSAAPAPRQRRKVYWEAGGPIRRVPLER